jgi:hypothetical protein
MTGLPGMNLRVLGFGVASVWINICLAGLLLRLNRGRYIDLISNIAIV